jgi:hypothetical protein
VQLVAAVCSLPLSLVALATHLQIKAMRQARFTEKMRQLGWLNPGFFDSTEDVETLKKCVTRYYGWVWLRSSPFCPSLTWHFQRFLTLIQDIGSFSVPTLDIDLVWQYVSFSIPIPLPVDANFRQHTPTFAEGVQKGLHSVCGKIRQPVSSDLVSSQERVR